MILQSQSKRKTDPITIGKEVRKLLAGGATLKSIADKCGVTLWQVRRWRDAPSSRIPPEKYLPWEGMQVITDDHLALYHTEAEIGRFVTFMRYQTCAMLPSGHTGYFVEDYERWLNGLPCID